MRNIGMLSIALLLAAGTYSAQAPQPAAPPVGTMMELMRSMVYPAANEVLLAIARPPRNDQEWMTVQRSAIVLAESGNVLMMPGRTRGEQGGEWQKHARMLVDAGGAAYKAARAKDAAALMAVDGPLNASCVGCHKQYRPNVHPAARQQ